jgi:hypothetical protein
MPSSDVSGDHLPGGATAGVCLLFVHRPDDLLDID